MIVKEKEIGESMASESKEKQQDTVIIKISVRNLVEFILRSGNLDNRHSTRADRDAMQKGSRLHRKLQGRMVAGYKAEVPLKYEIVRQKLTILLEGRADGVMIADEGVTIDEIKGIYRDLAYLDSPVEVHLAQAKCYAYIYAKQHQLDKITVRMTYCNIETEQIKYFYETYKIAELEEWFAQIIGEYEKWAEWEAEWKQIMQDSVKSLHFPFTYREGQKELVAGVYRTIQQKKKLFIQASTGVGKTISTVYPSIRAVGEGLADKIFYLTAKTITRTVAQETFQLLQEQNLQFKVIVLTAKEKLCVCEEVNCNPTYCSRAKGHFDRVNKAIYQLLTSETIITREVILKYAEEYSVCPFEMSLDVALWADAIICDYNYVFDYNICLKRFFGESIRGDYIFLIDEAHNLVERTREMYSASLYKEDFLALMKEVKYYSRKLEKILQNCNRILLEWKRECETYKVLSYSMAGNLSVKLLQLMTEMEKFMEEEEEEDICSKVLELYFQVRHFLNMFECLDDNYIVYTEFLHQKFMIRLFCVNPSVNLNNFLEKGKATVFFSATLLPITYYMKLLSGNMQDYTMYAESGFLEQQRCLLIATDVSSRYVNRNQKEYEKIVDYLEKTVRQKAGNYMAFFPSYSFMEAVYQLFQERQPGIRCLLQNPAMSEKQKEEFLSEYERKGEESLLGFCVLGGIFSEGIDLKHDRLIGSIIIGTGLPQICTEKELLKDYFDRNEGNGFDFAYRFPGLNKVLQAAGRVIRTEEDKGVILLLDKRFREPIYQYLFPREWEHRIFCSQKDIDSNIHEFWSRIPIQ